MDLLKEFQNIYDTMNTKETIKVELEFPDILCILTALKTVDYYTNTFDFHMKDHFARIKSERQ